MKKRSFLFCMGLLVTLALAAGLTAAAKPRLRVTAGVGNVRSGPGKEVIRQVPQGTILDYRGMEGEWYMVDLPPGPKGVVISGYIHRSLVEFVSGEASAPKAVAPAAVVKEESAPGPAEKAPAARVRKEAVPRPAARPSVVKKPVPPPATAAAEKKFAISILGGGGATFVNIPKDLDINEAWLDDWTKVNWRITLQGIYRLNSWLGIGGEFGYDTLYYATWNSPSVSWFHYVTVTATNIHMLAELNFAGSFFLQAGAGVFMFSESAGIGFVGALGGTIPINKALSLPVMVRLDAIPNAPMPLTLMLGLKMKLF
jgi:hypothetical protein